jgi:hypothetical protein
MVENIVMYLPTARQLLDKHVPAETDSWYTARCWVRRTTIHDNKGHPLLGNAFLTTEEVFPLGPPRDYISNPVVNQKSVGERERDWSESSAVD